MHERVKHSVQVQLRHGLISFLMLLFSSSMKARWTSVVPVIDPWAFGPQPDGWDRTVTRTRDVTVALSVFLRQPQRLRAEGDSRSNFSDDKPISKEVVFLFNNQKTLNITHSHSVSVTEIIQWSKLWLTRSPYLISEQSSFCFLHLTFIQETIQCLFIHSFHCPFYMFMLVCSLKLRTSTLNSLSVVLRKVPKCFSTDNICRDTAQGGEGI